MKQHKRLAAWLGPFGLLLLSGCGGVGEISGQVTYKGEPIPVGRITFLSEVGNKEVVSAYIIRGKYTVPRCPAGLAKIGIESLQPPPDAVLKGTKTLPIRAAGGMKAPEMPPELKELASGPPLKYVEIPLNFANPETSDLKYEVRRGAQTHDIPLD